MGRTMNIEKKIGTASACCMAFLVLFMSGCSTTTQIKKPTFYPPEPAPPKLQYLTSFTVSTNLVPPAGSFQRFLFGEDHSNLKEIVKQKLRP